MPSNQTNQSVKSSDFNINGTTYHPPARPIVVVCFDGCADEYLSHSIAMGRMPVTAKLAASGYRGMVRGALPSFTNVNNAAIVTGLPPAGTGICGNYFLDPQTGEETMMNDPSYLRAETILSAASQAGRKVAFVTAKDKLRRLLSKGLNAENSIAFSAEKADEATLAEHGIDDVISLVGPKPDIYSGDASLYVLKAGVDLMRVNRADFLYLSLTDYMQHAYAPHEAESLEFYEAIDELFGQLLEQGAILGVTADHGMNSKCYADGRPNVIYLEAELEEQFQRDFTVICPITDPYVKHHGALGSAVWVHVPEDSDVKAVASWILKLEGVTEVYDKSTAARKLQLAPDRIGDLFVMSQRDVVIGRRPEDHALNELHGRLRSHGGRYEEMVPMLLSEPLSAEYMNKAAMDPRNFDIFDFVCNGTLVTAEVGD